MNRKKALGLCMALCFMLAGCQNIIPEGIPEMTPKQEDQIIDYVVSVVAKYDAGYKERLVELEKIEEDFVAEVKPEEKPTIPDTPPASSGSQEPEGGSSISEGTSIEEFYQMGGVATTFLGYEVRTSYVEEHMGEQYFSLDAGEGARLLILFFEIENITSGNVTVDFLSAAPRFSISVNENRTIGILPTMLIDDMATYVGVLSTGQKASLVLMAEIDEASASNIETLDLVMWNASNTMTLRIQ